MNLYVQRVNDLSEWLRPVSERILCEFPMFVTRTDLAKLLSDEQHID